MKKNEIQKHIESLEAIQKQVANLKLAASEQLESDIAKDINKCLESLEANVDSLKGEIQAIQRISEIKHDIQNHILSPVTDKIKDSASTAISLIQEESKSSIAATKWWAVFSIVAALLISLFIERAIIFVIDFSQKQYAPRISYKVGLFRSEEQNFYTKGGSGPILPLTGDPSAFGEMNLENRSSAFSEEVCFSFDGSGFLLNEVYLCPNDDLPFATTGNCKLPLVTTHPLAIGKRRLAFFQKSDYPFRIPQQNSGPISSITLVNFLKKKPIRFRLIGEIFVPGNELGWPGKLWGGRTFTYFQDFELFSAKTPWATGTYQIW